MHHGTTEVVIFFFFLFFKSRWKGLSMTSPESEMKFTSAPIILRCTGVMNEMPVLYFNFYLRKKLFTVYTWNLWPLSVHQFYLLNFWFWWCVDRHSYFSWGKISWESKYQSWVLSLEWHLMIDVTSIVTISAYLCY